MIKLGNPKRLVMAGVTLGCALGIGYFMQLSTKQNAVVAESGDQQVDTAAFAAAFVGEPADAPAQEAEAAEQTVVAEASEDQAQVTVEDKLGEAATEDTLAATPKDAEKEALFEEAAVSEEEALNSDDLGLGDVTLTSAEPAVPAPPVTAPQPEVLPDTPLQLAALGDAPIGDLPREETAPSLSCEIEMTATPGAVAMVRLELMASCMSEQQFTLHHNGMMFSALTDVDGAWSMDVPALSETAVFIAAFDNGEGAVATTSVDTLGYYDRFVVQWKGESGLQIHAMEYGATYGEAGHVWRDTARDASAAAKGEGGFLVRLGDGIIEQSVLHAEVYTFPTQNALREGTVEVSLETEVNGGNCGRDIEAQALVKPGAGDINARDLTMAIPECDAVGDFLVLKNLYEDLKIARN